MHLTLRLFGAEVIDLSIGDDEPADEWVDCGTTGSTPIGFTLPDVPFEHDAPHRFDRGEGDEDV
jgi:hypothetical protein